MSGETEAVEAAEDFETHITTDRAEIDKIVGEARRLGHEVKVFATTVEGKVQYELHFFHKAGAAEPDDDDAEPPVLTAEEQAAKDAEEAAEEQAAKDAEEAAATAADEKAAKDAAAAAKTKPTGKPGSELL